MTVVSYKNLNKITLKTKIQNINKFTTRIIAMYDCSNHKSKVKIGYKQKISN